MKQLSPVGLLQLAVTEGAATPNPGSPCWVWSTSTNTPMYWTGTQWTAGASAGGGGSGLTTGVSFAISRGFALQ